MFIDFASDPTLGAPGERNVSVHNEPDQQRSARRVAVKLLKKQIKIERPKREKVTREQAIKRVKAFSKRKEKLIAAIREGMHRDIHS